MALVMALGSRLSDVPYNCVEDAAPIAVVLNDPHPGNALCNLAVNGIDEFFDGFVEDQVGRLRALASALISPICRAMSSNSRIDRDPVDAVAILDADIGTDADGDDQLRSGAPRNSFQRVDQPPAVGCPDRQARETCPVGNLNSTSATVMRRRSPPDGPDRCIAARCASLVNR